MAFYPVTHRNNYIEVVKFYVFNLCFPFYSAMLSGVCKICTYLFLVQFALFKNVIDVFCNYRTFFLKKFCHEPTKRVDRLLPGALKILEDYDWPGNVRELRNVIERAAIFAEGELITADDLLLFESTEKPKTTATADISLPNDGLSLFDLEKKLLSQAIEKSDGNQTQAAKLVGLSLDTFRYRLKKYDL